MNWKEGVIKLVTTLMIFEAIISLALIASVVLQSGKSQGLSGSIAGGADVLFSGRKKGLDQVLAKLTMVLGALFVIVTLALAKLMN